MFNAPQPRSRLYTSAQAYVRGLGGAMLGYDASGEGVAQLEGSLEAMAPGYRAIAAPMARVAIYLAVKHLIRRGQKVILSPYTISDVVNMVLCAGGVPLFADIEPGGSFNIDAGRVEELLRSEKDVGAVLVTHFYGLVCNIDPILRACQERGVPVIEDAAQAFGAALGGRKAGALADVGIFSFGLLKNVTGFIGGILLVRESRVADAIRAELAGWPLAPRKGLLKKMFAGVTLDGATLPVVFDAAVYWMFRYALLHDRQFFKNKLDTDSNPVAYSRLPAAYAVRMSDAQAGIVLPQLSRYEEATRKRVERAKMYDAGLAGLPGIVRPPLRTDGSHIYLNYCIQAEQRDELAKFMTVHLRDVQVSHHRNCASLPCFAQYARDCPNADKAAQRVIYLPVYPAYREEQVRANIEVIRAHQRKPA